LKGGNKIIEIIERIRSRKRTGFIYNIPDNIRETSLKKVKKAVIINAVSYNTKPQILSALFSKFNVTRHTIINQHAQKIELFDKMKKDDIVIIVNKGEYVFFEFNEMDIPCVVVSSYKKFYSILKEKDYYKNKIFIEYDYKDLS